MTILSAIMFAGLIKPLCNIKRLKKKIKGLESHLISTEMNTVIPHIDVVDFFSSRGRRCCFRRVHQRLFHKAIFVDNASKNTGFEAGFVTALEKKS